MQAKPKGRGDISRRRSELCLCRSFSASIPVFESNMPAFITKGSSRFESVCCVGRAWEQKAMHALRLLLERQISAGAPACDVKGLCF